MKTLTKLFFALLIAALFSFTSHAGMRMTVSIVDADKVVTIQRSTALIDKVLSETNTARALTLDKAWAGINFLLNGTNKNATGPKSWVIFGGKEIGNDLGYGRARLLTPSEVKQIAAVLKEETREKLWPRYDPVLMEKSEVYPEDIWIPEGKEAFDYLMEYYEKLRAFYDRAAQSGSGVVMAIE